MSKKKYATMATKRSSDAAAKRTIPTKKRPRAGGHESLITRNFILFLTPFLSCCQRIKKAEIDVDVTIIPKADRSSLPDHNAIHLLLPPTGNVMMDR
jgi:hypothetical protein